MCKLFGHTKQAYYKRISNLRKDPTVGQQVKEMVLDIRYKLPGTVVRKLHFMLRNNLIDKGLKIGRDKLFGNTEIGTSFDRGGNILPQPIPDIG